MMRVYSNRDRARLTIIVRLKRLGLPLADIREILDLYALNDGKRAQTRMMLEKFRKQVKELEIQREDIDTALGELRKGIVWLEGLVDQVGPSEEGKRQAAAYEAVARRQLDEV
jgi:DNA-binding transcriptional MerR regulator